MPSFEELVDMIKNATGNSGEPVDMTIYDDLRQYHATALQGADAKLTQKDERIQSLESEISRLKSNNYDLLMQTQATPPDPRSGPESDESDDDGPKPGIDSLFQR